MDKLSAMQTFAVVVETGSFTSAAEILGVPKARVSQRVADLERHLGVRLIQRTTRKLNLTEEGNIYVTKCRRILADIDEAEDVLVGGLNGPKGRLRVDALISVARWVIAPRLKEFHERYPGIAVRLGATDRISHMLEEGIDCTIRGGNLEPSDQIARHICDVSAGLYASPEYLAKAPTVAHPRDLASHTLLSWYASQTNAFQWKLLDAKVTHEQTYAAGLSFDDPDVAIASCLAGAGICPASPFAVEQWVGSGLLLPVLPDWHFAPRPIHLVYPNKKHMSIRVRCFVEWVMAIVEESETLRLTPALLASRIGK